MKTQIKEKQIRRREFVIYSMLACGIACAAASVLLVAMATIHPVARLIAAPGAAAAWTVACILLVWHLGLRLPLVLSPDRLTVRGPRSDSVFRLGRVLEARWSIAFRNPTLSLRTCEATVKIKFSEFEYPDQLVLVRYFRKYVPARAHRDWYRFCRYAIYLRRRVMVDARDTRTPSQRRWETIFRWVGVTTEATLLGMFSREAGQAHLNRELAEEAARNAIPHEAFSDSEPEERWLEFSAWFAFLAACLLPLIAYFVVGWWRITLFGAAAALLAWSLFAWRKQSQFEEELALETAAEVIDRWEKVEEKTVR